MSVGDTMDVLPPDDPAAFLSFVEDSSKDSALPVFEEEEIFYGALAIFLQDLQYSYLLGANPTVHKNDKHSNFEHAHRVANTVARTMTLAGYDSRDPEVDARIIEALTHDGGEVYREWESLGGKPVFVDDQHKFEYEKRVIAYSFRSAAIAYVTGSFRRHRDNQASLRFLANAVSNKGAEAPNIVLDAMGDQTAPEIYDAIYNEPGNQDHKRPLKQSEFEKTPYDSSIERCVGRLMRQFKALENKTLQGESFWASFVKWADKGTGTMEAVKAQHRKKDFPRLEHQNSSRVHYVMTRSEKYLFGMKANAWGDPKQQKLFEVCRVQAYMDAQKFLSEGPLFIGRHPDPDQAFFPATIAEYRAGIDYLSAYHENDKPFDPAAPLDTEVLSKEEAILLCKTAASIPGYLPEGGNSVLTASSYPPEFITRYRAFKNECDLLKNRNAPYLKKIATLTAKQAEQARDVTQKTPSIQPELDFDFDGDPTSSLDAPQCRPT
jgi:hypothetical protein